MTGAVEHPTENPNYEIQIFAGSECPGAPIAVGTAEQLETSGISVTVAANAKSTLSARQVDPGTLASSPCSAALFYWEGSVPKGRRHSRRRRHPGGEAPSGEEGGGAAGGGSEAGGGSPAAGGSGGSSSGGSISGGTPVGGKPEAPHIHVSPAERANDPTPLIAGSAPGADSVILYAGGDCRGAVGRQRSRLPALLGLRSRRRDECGDDLLGGRGRLEQSSCSSPVTYTEDSIPPRTRITMGPGVKTRKHRAVFRFKDVTEDPPGTTFRCMAKRLVKRHKGKRQKAKWRACSSPFRLKHLKLGRYVVKIRATDLVGNHERRAVKRRFLVVRGPHRLRRSSHSRSLGRRHGSGGKTGSSRG